MNRWRFPRVAGRHRTAGCQSSLSGDTYSVRPVRREMSVRMGTVESVRRPPSRHQVARVLPLARPSAVWPASRLTAGAIAGAVVGMSPAH